jgi:hypothetical protein
MEAIINQPGAIKVFSNPSHSVIGNTGCALAIDNSRSNNENKSMLARVFSCAVIGLEGVVVEV